MELLAYLESFTDSVQFERLCCDVLSLVGFKGIDPQGVGRKDAGKDAILHDPVHGKVLGHFSLRQDWGRKIKEDIQHVASMKYSVDLFVFMTNRRVTAADKDKWKAYCQSVLGCRLEIYDQERLRVVLSTEKNLCYQYFPDVLIPTIVERLEKSIETLSRLGMKQPDSQLLTKAPEVVQERIIELSEYARLNNIDEVMSRAAELHRIARTISATVAAGFLYIGCIAVESKNICLAERMFLYALDVKPDYFESCMNLAIMMEHNSKGVRYGYGFRAQEALKIYDRAISIARSQEATAECLDNKGVVYVKMKDYDKARRCFSLASERNPSYVSSQLNLATIDDDLVRSEKILSSLINSKVGDLARLNLIYRHVRQHRLREALLDLYHFKKRRNWPESNIQLAKIAIARKKFSRARLYLERILGDNYDNPEIHFFLGVSFFREANWNSASLCFEKAIELQPDWDEPYYFAGQNYEKMGEKYNTKVIDSYEKAKDLNPHIRNLHNRLGNAYQQERMFATARINYRRELELYPDNEAAQFNLGVLAEYDADGKRYASRQCLLNANVFYLDALKYNQKYTPALFNLGTNYLMLEKYKEAAEMLETALTVTPENDLIMCNLAMALWRLGHIEAAQEYLNRALSINPQNPYAEANLAALLKYGNGFSS